jgi:hypothetical protein
VQQAARERAVEAGKENEEAEGPIIRNYLPRKKKMVNR